MATVTQLADIDLQVLASMSAPSRLSLFANIYNALIVHATAVIGPPEDNTYAREIFFSGRSGARYCIGGINFSPDDIEHGILRADTRHPYSTPTGQNSYWKRPPVADRVAYDEYTEKKKLSLLELDPRIHFLLNCGATSCPPIKVLKADPEPALRIAAASYLMSETHFLPASSRDIENIKNIENLEIVGAGQEEEERKREDGQGLDIDNQEISIKTKAVLVLPKLLLWYAGTFVNILCVYVFMCLCVYVCLEICYFYVLFISCSFTTGALES